MSRIGKSPIKLPKGVTVNVDKTNTVSVKGPKGELKQQLTSDISIEVKESELNVLRPSDEKQHKALHGLYRSLLNNMVHGVSEGYEVKLELIGVGYKAEAKGDILELSLGFSHDIFMQMPPEVKVEALTEKRANPIITLKSIDCQLIGHVAAKIRSLRKPEPYKGKGIRYVGEYVRKKAGKTASV